MAGRVKKVKNAIDANLLDKKGLENLLSKKVKEFTTEMKNEGKKYGIILDVAVIVREVDK